MLQIGLSCWRSGYKAVCTNSYTEQVGAETPQPVYNAVDMLPYTAVSLRLRNETHTSQCNKQRVQREVHMNTKKSLEYEMHDTVAELSYYAFFCAVCAFLALLGKIFASIAA